MTSFEVKRAILREEFIPVTLMGRFDTTTIRAAEGPVSTFKAWVCYYDHDQQSLFSAAGIIQYANSLDQVSFERLSQRKPLKLYSGSISDERKKRVDEKISAGMVQVKKGAWAIQVKGSMLVDYAQLTKEEAAIMNVRNVGMNGIEGMVKNPLNEASTPDPQITRRLARVNPYADSWIV